MRISARLSDIRAQSIAVRGNSEQVQSPWCGMATGMLDEQGGQWGWNRRREGKGRMR